VRTEEALVRRQCGIEVLDRDAEMVNTARPHAGEATERALRRTECSSGRSA
jgi:hypothetical protein